MHQSNIGMACEGLLRVDSLFRMVESTKTTCYMLVEAQRNRVSDDSSSTTMLLQQLHCCCQQHLA
jgi:hypothetical protein